MRDATAEHIERTYGPEIEETEALVYLSNGFEAAEAHPALIHFDLPSGRLTYFRDGPEEGDAWHLLPSPPDPFTKPIK